MFNEYMNWGLVALRYLDRAPAEDHEKLMIRLDSFMGEGKTVADLYPAIVEWFATHEASGGRTQVKG